MIDLLKVHSRFSTKKEETKMTGRKPEYRVATPTEGGTDETKTYWTNIGSGWKGKNNSINLTLTALPVNGRICLFENTEDEQKTQKRF